MPSARCVSLRRLTPAWLLTLAAACGATEAQARLAKDHFQMLSLDQVFQLVDRLADLVKTHVHDEDALQAIQDGMAKFIPPVDQAN